MNKHNFNKIMTLFLVSGLIISNIKIANAQVGQIVVPAMELLAEEIAQSAIANAARTSAAAAAVQYTKAATADYIATQASVNALIQQATAAAKLANPSGPISTLDGLKALAGILGIPIALSSSTAKIGTDGKSYTTTQATTLGNYTSPQNLNQGDQLYTTLPAAVSPSNPGYSSPSQAIYSYYLKGSKVSVGQCAPNADRPDIVGCMYEDTTSPPYYWSGPIYVYQESANKSTVNCSGSNPYTDGTACMYDPTNGATAATAQTQTQTQASSSATVGMSPEVQAQPITDQSIADLANQVMADVAAQPGYPGVPYNPANPITAADVKTATQAQPTSPSIPIGSLTTTFTGNATVDPYSPPTAPNAVSPTGPQVQTQPQTQNNNNTPPPPPEPVYGTPNLEPTPTIDKIIDPFLNLMPDLKKFAMPNYTATCPPFSFHFTLYGKDMGGDYMYHCQIVSDHRTAIRSMMIAFYTISIVFIFLM